MERETRSEINRALAKAIAYKDCGKHDLAAEYAAELVRLLGCADILIDIVSG
ncbi:MAG: hypothetical protein ACRDRO_07865 [Pseudonocardiaceae bacterium]